MGSNNYNYNKPNRGGSSWNQNYNTTRGIEPKEVPDDYVDAAEKIIVTRGNPNNITTTKLRKILTMINDIYNVEASRSDRELTKESQEALQIARVRIAYECGRDGSVKAFVKDTLLLNYIKGIKKSRKAFMDFAHYMEALVAFHRYYGGKD